MANSEYLRLESTTDNTKYNILVGFGHFVSKTDPNMGMFQVDKRGENFYNFMTQHGGETFKIFGTNTKLTINEYSTKDETYPTLYFCSIQTKNKRPLLAYILIEIVYNVKLLIGRRLVVQEFNKLDFKKIRKYYEFYELLNNR